VRRARQVDSAFWDLIAYCAGTGGSMLVCPRPRRLQSLATALTARIGGQVIGSAAGIAYMSFERTVSFGWYLRNISPGAAAGYLAGIATLSAQAQILAQLAKGEGP